MKNIIVTTLFFLLSTNAFGCYDESLSGKDNFDSHLVQARMGDAESQFMLGLIHAQGCGVTQSHDNAIKWYSKAARQGSTKAQNNIGVIHYRKAQNDIGFLYFRSEQGNQNIIKAHKWFSIAAANGDEGAFMSTRHLAERMTASQIEKAQDMAREWMAKHQ